MRYGFFSLGLLAFWIAASASLLSCSSLHETAEKYFAAEDYEDAADTYQKILKQDPGDLDATLGLKKSREKIVDTKLIQVRLSRIAGNEQNSLAMLLKIVEEENRWGMYPKGRVAFTQEEESAEAFRYLKEQVQDFNRKSYPVAAAFLLQKYQPIFAGNLADDYRALKESTATAGIEKCQSLRKWVSPKLPFYSRFVERFCGTWPREDRDPALAKALEAPPPDEYGKIRIELAVSALPEPTGIEYRETLEKAFEKSPWYDASSSHTLFVRLAGKFTKTESQSYERREQAYVVSVPYTTYEPMATVPMGMGFGCHHRRFGGCGGFGFGGPMFMQSVPVTRYRDELRTQAYDGYLKSQTLSLSVSGTITFPGHPQALTLSEKSQKSDFEHSWNLPNLRLVPHTAELPDPIEWSKQQAHLLSDQFKEKNEALWERLYCLPQTSSLPFAAEGERIHRCLRLKKTPFPHFAEAWYERNLGVSAEEAGQVLDLK